MVQKDLYKNAVEVTKEAESDYEEDFNRIDAELNSKTITSKEEYQQRLRQKGYDTISKKFLDKYWEERISKYIEENKPKVPVRVKIRYMRKGKPVYREPSKKWTKELEDYIRNNPDKKPKELYKMALFSGRTKKSITSKRFRLFRRKYEAIEKGYGKKYERKHRLRRRRRRL